MLEFYKGTTFFHALTDKQTDIHMQNYIHSMAPTSFSKCTKLELCTIVLSMASSV